MNNISDDILELQEYANIEGSELGEACWALIGLFGYRDYISDECAEIIKNEILKQLKNFKENSEIIEEEETHTTKYQKLVWNTPT
jgi:hypothetical protein